MKVDFFIVGAPKSGTTSLSEYLSTHPDLCMAFPKEPSYFCDDFPGIRLATSEQDYESLFSKCSDTTLRGDASTAYLMSQTAIKNINQYNPLSKIIVILRNPVDMLPSWHSQMIYSLFESETDFQTAYGMQSDRTNGINIPETCREGKYLLYSEVARYDEQIQRLLNVCGKERALVLIYDDFIKDARSSYLKVLDFLGVKDDGRTFFPAVNISKSARFSYLNRVLHNPPAWLWKLLHASNNTYLRDSLFRGHEILKRFNTAPLDRAPLDPEFSEKLKSDFRPVIDKLSGYIERDLSHWYR